MHLRAPSEKGAHGIPFLVSCSASPPGANLSGRKVSGSCHIAGLRCRSMISKLMRVPLGINTPFNSVSRVATRGIMDTAGGFKRSV